MKLGENNPKDHSCNEQTKWQVTWNPDKLLEQILMEKPIETDWCDTTLPSLVKNMIKNYDATGVMEYLEKSDLPSKNLVIEALENLLIVMFPGLHGAIKITKTNLQAHIELLLQSIYSQLVQEIEKSLKYVCRKIEKCPEKVCFRRAQIVVTEVLNKLPVIRQSLLGDIHAAYEGDSAAQSLDEVVISYPCVLAIATYRIAHELYSRSIPLIPRILSEYAHSQTGIDIHPGARIGKNFFIDHGTGVVIGETAEIGNNVRIYQGVTLGGLSYPKDAPGKLLHGQKRHPTIGNNVILYSGASILGSDATIGDAAIIGGNVWITSKVPPNTQVTIIPPQLQYQEMNENKTNLAKEK